MLVFMLGCGEEHVHSNDYTVRASRRLGIREKLAPCTTEVSALCDRHPAWRRFPVFLFTETDSRGPHFRNVPPNKPHVAARYNPSGHTDGGRSHFGGGLMPSVPVTVTAPDPA